MIWARLTADPLCAAQAAANGICLPCEQSHSPRLPEVLESLIQQLCIAVLPSQVPLWRCAPMGACP